MKVIRGEQSSKVVSTSNSLNGIVIPVNAGMEDNSSEIKVITLLDSGIFNFCLISTELVEQTKVVFRGTDYLEYEVCPQEDHLSPPLDTH